MRRDEGGLMPTIIQVAEAIGKQLAENIRDLKVHDTPPSSLTAKGAAVVIRHGDGDYVQPGDDYQCVFTVTVYVLAGTASDGWRRLAPYLDLAGDYSIPAAIRTDDKVGLDGVGVVRVESHTAPERSDTNGEQYEATITLRADFDGSVVSDAG